MINIKKIYLCDNNWITNGLINENTKICKRIADIFITLL